MLESEKVKTLTLAAITCNWLQEESENGKIYNAEGLIDHENIEMGEIFERSWRADDRGHGILGNLHVVEIILLTMLVN